jgi:hypothetical protein
MSAESSDSNRRLMTVKEVAAMLNFSVQGVYRWTRRLTAQEGVIHVGHQVKVDWETFYRWVQNDGPRLWASGTNQAQAAGVAVSSCIQIRGRDE